jgi:hypothetical protein
MKVSFKQLVDSLQAQGVELDDGGQLVLLSALPHHVYDPEARKQIHTLLDSMLDQLINPESLN